MKIERVPHTFITGETLSPRDLNDNYSHLELMTTSVQDKRYCHSIVVIPYHEDASTPYTESGSHILKTKFTPANQLTIERGYLRFYGNSATSDDVNIDIEDSSGVTIAGVDHPYLSCDPGTTDASATAFNAQRVTLEAGVTYQFAMECSGQFYSKHSFLELHLRSDRFNIAGTDLVTEFTASGFTTSTTLDAGNVTSEFSEIDTAVTSITANTKFSRVECYVAHNFVNGADADQFTWRLPRVDSDDVSRTITKVVATGTIVAGASGTTSVQVQIADPSFSTFSLDQEMSWDVAEIESTLTFTTPIALSSSTADPSSAADDRVIRLVHNGIGDNVDKLVLWLYYE